MKFSIRPSIAYSIAILALAGTVGWQLTAGASQVIKFQNVSFRVPARLDVQEVPSTGDYYKNFQISNPKVNHPNGKSTISIGIPIKNLESATSLVDEIPPHARATQVKAVELKGKTGVGATYRAEGQFPGDVTVQEQVISERYPSEFPNSPYSLTYQNTDWDHSLDKAWQMIRNSLSW